MALGMAGDGMRAVGPCPHQEDLLIFVDWEDGSCMSGCAYRLSAISAGRRTREEQGRCETCENETREWTAGCQDADTLAERARERGWRVFEEHGSLGPGFGALVNRNETPEAGTEIRKKGKSSDSKRRRRNAQRRARRVQRRK